MMSTAPEIDTPRLRLRGHRRDDLPECLSLWSDPLVTRFIGAPSASEQRTWARLLAYVGHWALMGFGYWAIEERASGRLVGEIGFADFRRDAAPLLRTGAELGFALASRCHGQGYATEAVRRVLAWGDAHLPYERCVCLVDERNEASLRVLAKTGFTELERSPYNGQPAVFLQRPIPAPPAR
ncbi:MAG: GNAT family N-acetyltransferase [Steroidobacteraceae bacterium]